MCMDTYAALESRLRQRLPVAMRESPMFSLSMESCAREGSQFAVQYLDGKHPLADVAPRIAPRGSFGSLQAIHARLGEGAGAGAGSLSDDAMADAPGASENDDDAPANTKAADGEGSSGECKYISLPALYEWECSQPFYFHGKK